MHWYYSKHGTQLGPVSQAELSAKIASGEISATELVWKDGMSGWTSASQLTEFSGIPVSPYATPASPGPQTQYPSHLQAAPTSGLAITSLVCGILGLTTCLMIPGIPAVICGHMALSNIKNSLSPIGGRGLAIAGVVMGYIAIAIILVFTVIVVIGAVTESSTSF